MCVLLSGRIRQAFDHIPSHEAPFAILDETNDSKLLVTTRIKGLLPGGAEVSNVHTAVAV